jgi:1-acyl-sn-glycerol-3-phosphate acyltransferase
VERLLETIERRRGGVGQVVSAPPENRLYTVLKVPAVGIARTMFRLESRGRENVPATGAVLLAANHSSVLDPPLIGSATDRQLSFLAKAELFDLPLLGGLIRRVNARPIRREGADPSALRTAMRVLEDGGALLIFPEGTRGDEGIIRSAKTGAGMLAVLSGAAVVPVFIKGSGRAWPRGRKLPRPARVTVTFGTALRFEAERGADRKRQYEIASREMMEAITRLKDGGTDHARTRWSAVSAARSK